MTDEIVARPRRPFYRRDPITSIVFTLLIYVFSQVIAAILIGLYPALQNWTESQASQWLKDSVIAQFAYTLLAEAVAIFMVLWLIKRAGVIKPRIGLVRPLLKDVGYALISYGLYFITYIIVITVSTALVPSLDTEQKQQIGFETAYGNVAMLLTFLTLVVFVPIGEEVVFRGYLFSALRSKLRYISAALLTSVIFGLLHLQFGSDAPLLWVAALDTFVLSCFLCYLREKTDSLWAPFMLHAAKNLAAFVVLFGPRIL